MAISNAMGLNAEQIERLWNEIYEQKQVTYDEMARIVHSHIDESMMYSAIDTAQGNSYSTWQEDYIRSRQNVQNEQNINEGTTTTNVPNGAGWYISPSGDASFTSMEFTGVSDVMKGQVAPKKLNKKVDVRILNKLLIKLKT